MAVFAGIANIVNIRCVILVNNAPEFSLELLVENKVTLCDFLASNCHLSKIKIKDALIKGAALLQRNRSKRRRVRKAKFLLLPGDKIQFCYSEKILRETPPNPTLVHEEPQYSVWNKPAGMLSQGTQYGDHCSLLRYIEIYFNNKRDIRLIHRLDRDANGIILFAHNRPAAKKLSKLFLHCHITKKYNTCVHGIIGSTGKTLQFSNPIGGKNALTEIRVIEIDKIKNISWLEVNLLTGRKHQIRRHLSEHGYPIVGDNLYGSKAGNRKKPLQLTASFISFTSPFTQSKVTFQL